MHAAHASRTNPPSKSPSPRSADVVDGDAILDDVALVEDVPAIDITVIPDAVAVDARLDDAPEAEVDAALDVVAIEPAVIVEPVYDLQHTTTDIEDVPVFEAAVVVDAIAGSRSRLSTTSSVDATLAVDSDLELGRPRRQMMPRLSLLTSTRWPSARTESRRTGGCQSL